MTMHVIFALAGYFIFSAAAGAMSAPTEAQNRGFYGWFYRFVQRLAANADRLAEARFGSLAAQPAAGDGAAALAMVATTRTTEQTTSIAATSGNP